MRAAGRGAQQNIGRRLAQAPIVMVAIDLADETDAVSMALGTQIERVMAATPGVRLAFINVMTPNRAAQNHPLDAEGGSIHMRRLVDLKYWANALHLGTAHVTFHVLEAPDPAAALIDYARMNRVDQMLVGAKARVGRRPLLGGIVARIVADAPCTVTVVRERTAEDAAGNA